MQFFAMLTMLIDHIGYLFFPDHPLWRIVGRIAFPLYAYGVILGFQHTANLRKYLTRLLILALISQIPYMLLFNTITLNVIFTLLISLLFLLLLDRFQDVRIKIIIFIPSIFIIGFIPIDYGAYGLLLILIYHYAQAHCMLLLHLGLNIVYFVYIGWEIQLYSIVPTFFIAYVPTLMKLGRSVTPKWLWRSFYPAHLLILAVVSYFSS